MVTLTINLWAIFNDLKMKISTRLKKKKKWNETETKSESGQGAIKLRHFGGIKKRFVPATVNISIGKREEKKARQA